MTILTVTIKKKKAIKILEDLRNEDLIEFALQKKPPRKASNKDKILTHIASEKVLAKIWLNEKENKAWQGL